MKVQKTHSIEISKEIYEALKQLAYEEGCSLEEILEDKIIDCILEEGSSRGETSEKEINVSLG